MPAFNQDFLDKLTERFGDKLDIQAHSGIIAEILEMAKNNPDIYGNFEDSDVAKGYERTYTQGMPYEKTYVRYDKTLDGKWFDDVKPDIEELIKKHILNINKKDDL